MRRRWSVFLLAIAVMLFLALPALAADGDDPDTWAQDAVQFAVENGLMDEANLRPRDFATRAELASMVVRLFGAGEMADLTGCSDVPGSAWYYEDMAKAVAMGVLEGSNGKLQPEATLTREQAMVILGRCFGVAEGDTAVLSSFADGYLVSDWSAGMLSSLIEQGTVNGTGTLLDPLGTITRQELAQLLYKLSGTVVRGEEIPSRVNGNATVLTNQQELANLTVDGDLYLCAAQQETMTLRNVRVQGKLVIHGGNVRLTGTSKAGEIVTTGTKVTLETGTNSSVRVAGGSAVLLGSGEVLAQAPVTLEEGNYSLLTVDGTTVTVTAGASVKKAELIGAHSRITGSGTVSNAIIYQKDCLIETADTDIETQIDTTLDGAQIVAQAPATEATPAQPAIQSTIRLDNGTASVEENTEATEKYGVLSWYLDGVLVGKDWKFPLTDGATATVNATVSYAGRLVPTYQLEARLLYKGETISLIQTADRHIEQASSPVRTLEVKATVRYDTSLYGYSDLSGWKGNVKAGTQVVYDNYVGQYSGRIRLPDGTVGWVSWSSLAISNADFVRYTDYTTVEKENFVNIHGYESKTDYLVWISLLTQKVNVFEGSSGQWQLVHTFSCCTGKNTTPTIAGVFEYQYRQNYWDFGYYIVKRPMIFNGGHAFHTRTYVKSTGGLLDPTIGKPASQGCVRMYDADVNWLWDNMPFGTTVVVF